MPDYRIPAPDYQAKDIKTGGLGTVIALVIPYSVVVLITWLLFFIAWFLPGIPMGPGYPATL